MPNTIVITEGENYKKENYNITKDEGNLTITSESVNTDDVLKKTHTVDTENGSYGVGDVITFEITVKNIYNEERYR